MKIHTQTSANIKMPRPTTDKKVNKN